MAELLLPKQIVRVRFPSFAPLWFLTAVSILKELKTRLIQDETFMWARGPFDPRCTAWALTVVNLFATR